MEAEYQKASDLVTKLRSLVDSLPYPGNGVVVSGETLRLWHQQGEVLVQSQHPQFLEMLEALCESVDELEYLLNGMSSYEEQLNEAEKELEALQEQSEELSDDKEFIRSKFEDYVQEHPPKKRWLKKHGQPWEE